MGSPGPAARGAHHSRAPLGAMNERPQEDTPRNHGPGAPSASGSGAGGAAPPLRRPRRRPGSLRSVRVRPTPRATELRGQGTRAARDGVASQRRPSRRAHPTRTARESLIARWVRSRERRWVRSRERRRQWRRVPMRSLSRAAWAPRSGADSYRGAVSFNLSIRQQRRGQQALGDAAGGCWGPVG